jgi:NAD(P)-dependent dehydrogenase (short-subunit alcohol dehydrogenase family)
MEGTYGRRCEGKVALVTGASRGIGKAIAERLAAEGARVAVSGRTLEPDERYEGSLRETVEQMTARGHESVAVQCDLSKPDDRSRVVEETIQRLGAIDILVNNAAVTFFLPFSGFPEKRWRLMFEVQVRAPYELAQLVVPSMRERGEGWILNISSRAGVHPQGPPFDDPFHTSVGVTVYSMVKAALDRFSTALAAELYDDHIAVNSLSPWDNVATPGAGHHDLVAEQSLEGPEWMAEAALLLCSSPPGQLTGRVAYSQPLLAEHNVRPVTDLG